MHLHLARAAAMLLIACSAVSARAEATRAERVAALIPEIDKLYADLANAEHLPGLTIGVVLDGKLVHTRSFGLADVERRTPVSADTEFRIASMTKSFVAMAAMKLRDEGKLGLDDPVVKYLPELRGVTLPTADSPAVTIRQLMTMTTSRLSRDHDRP